jgi:hypothetical protein
MTTRLPFTEQSLRRAIRAARKEGVQVAGFTVGPDGSITVLDASLAPTLPRAQHVASEFEEFEA